MKKVLLLTLILFCTLTFGQKITDTPNEQNVIYKGFKVGMTKSEAKKEFNRDKEAYKYINLNGSTFTVSPYANLHKYDKNDKLIGISIFPLGSAKNKSTTTEYFDNSKDFFEKHGYQLSFTPNTSHMYHIFMNNTDKNTVMEMFTTVGGLPLFYFIFLTIYNYDELIKTDYYNKMAKTINFGKNDTQNDTGF